MPSHTAFIVAAYVATAAILVALVAAVVLDGRALRRALSRMASDRPDDAGAGP